VLSWGEIKTIKYLLIVLGSFDDLGQKLLSGSKYFQMIVSLHIIIITKPVSFC
jgi:hypothetical protein